MDDFISDRLDLAGKAFEAILTLPAISARVFAAVTLLTIFRGQTKLEIPQARLAEKANCTKAQAQAGLKRLSEEGLIHVTFRLGLPSLIRLTLEKPWTPGEDAEFWETFFAEIEPWTKGPM